MPDTISARLSTLHVERGIDIYAGRQQLLDVALAFGVTAFGGVGVGQFIDQDELAARGQRRVQIEILNDAPLRIDRAKRKLRKPTRRRLCPPGRASRQSRP